jgi:hypothetical protein
LGATSTALAGVLAATIGGGIATAATTPKATVSISGWNLTLPVDSSGCQCGSAEQLSPAAITPPWLTRNSDGSLGFWAPTKGATTPNSTHPRTELVSTSSFSGGSSGTHTLNATLSIQQLPSANDIIIGQIHGGGSSSSIPLLLLHYTSGNLVVWIRPTPSTGSSPVATVLTGIPLNASFSYTITESGTSMSVSATYGSAHGSATIALPSGFDGMTLRFQAGDYQQTAANSSSTDGGRMTVTALSKN